MNKNIIIIPARMASTRLPGKPLADIHGKPMILHVFEQAKKANQGEVVVACSEDEVYQTIVKAGGRAIMTDPQLASGTDRVFAALEQVVDADSYDCVINLQGDLPTIRPEHIKKVIETLRGREGDIATLVAPLQNEAEFFNPNIVKAIIANDQRGLYFSRSPVPHGDWKNAYHHIGIYAYKRDVLKAFVGLPPSPLEVLERLEQLRALEKGWKIVTSMIDEVPFGVDTMEDLEEARALIKGEFK